MHIAHIVKTDRCPPQSLLFIIARYNVLYIRVLVCNNVLWNAAVVVIMYRWRVSSVGGNRVTWLHNTSRHVGVTNDIRFFSTPSRPVTDSSASYTTAAAAVRTRVTTTAATAHICICFAPFAGFFHDGHNACRNYQRSRDAMPSLSSSTLPDAEREPTPSRSIKLFRNKIKIGSVVTGIVVLIVCDFTPQRLRTIVFKFRLRLDRYYYYALNRFVFSPILS